MTPWVLRLLIANFAVFGLTAFQPQVANYLALYPRAILIQPWGIFTYMFVHAGLGHIFFNMLILYFFGPPLESMWGGREFVKYYLATGLSAAALSFFTPHAGVIGASGAIYGIMLAFALNWPDMQVWVWFLFPVRIKWLVAFMAAVSVLSLVGGEADGVAHWAHLGGFLGGFLYLRVQDRVGMQVRQLRKTVAKRKFSATPGGSGDDDSAPPPRPGSRAESRVLDEVDRVLDKISESGLQSLTEEELELLDRVSKKYRQN